MKKTLKKIEKQLRGLSDDEKNDILGYYEEVINDRLETGESIQEIGKTLNFYEIKRLHVAGGIYEKDNIRVKESLVSSSKLLLYLFTSPLWIPLGLVYLTIIIVFYAVMLALIISGIAAILSPIIFVSYLVVEQFSIATIVLGSGTYLVAISLALLIFLMLFKAFKMVNNGMIKLISRFVGGKKRKEAVK